MKTPSATELDLRSGGGFLLCDPTEAPIFVPEGFSEMQRDFYDACTAFMNGEIIPRNAEIERGDAELNRELLRKTCELGLCSVEVPEEHGGLGLGKITAFLVAEGLSGHGSYATTFGAHSSIGTLPIVYFGNEETKRELLPKLCSGEVLSCYALTETGSGSDALAAKCKAVLNAEGTHYLLSGSKQFISNGACSDIAVVFAKVDGSQFTGFVVDLKAPGVEIGPDEHKMGIRGSNTNALHFDQTPVPVERVLGEIGKGHRIAFNILNLGRMKLATAALGGCKRLLALCLGYAGERHQFGRPIRDFGAMRQKFSRMGVATFATESACYRTAGDMDRRLLELAGVPEVEKFAAIEEFAAEAAICKVMGSEAAGMAADEAVQIHGGYGYTEEYPVEQAYRDTRINRIYEGTNEINRMLIPGTLLKRALKGRLDLMSVAPAITAELADEAYEPPHFDGEFGHERSLLHLMKRRTLYTMNNAAMKLQTELQERQEVLMALADMIIALYAADSCLARAMQLDASRDTHPGAWFPTKIYVREAWDVIDTNARRVLFHIAGSKGKVVHRNNLAVWDLLPEADVLGLELDYA
ncbi:MAG: acyl-CoA dehydrogenase family protein, partial [Deltaproteobacteria bacterium]|nr:acyl-CoA dehydrogenase family protein [Deltaproteobacteria bacterium]MBW2530812.1 acyl-CoA dehydrogenase family protein [Deltaproteobacteria bacterium]